MAQNSRRGFASRRYAAVRFRTGACGDLATLDILSNRPGEAADTVDIGGVKPLVRPNREECPPETRMVGSALGADGKPRSVRSFWRPPRGAVVAPPLEKVNVPATHKAAGPDRSPLARIGAVVGDSDAIAIFLDRTSQKIVRLRQGETMRAGG